MSSRDSSLPPNWETGARLLAPLTVWVIRGAMQNPNMNSLRFGIVIVDACLVALHIWANEPVRRAQGKRFAEAGRGSSFLLGAVVIAVFFLIRDCWYAVR
jgi:hypothetical protein